MHKYVTWILVDRGSLARGGGLFEVVTAGGFGTLNNVGIAHLRSLFSLEHCRRNYLQSDLKKAQ